MAAVLEFDATSRSTARANDLMQVVRIDPDQASMLTDDDPYLAANKRLVYDFWREVFEAGHMDLAETYVTESFELHNPHVPAGRQAFVDFFSMVSPPKPIVPRVQAPLTSVVADGDFVVMSFASEQPCPKDPAKTDTVTWFDMFRIEAGKIAEHWDPPPKEWCVEVE